MRAGTLDRRVSILQATTTYDALNEPVRGFAVLATVWAAVKQEATAEGEVDGVPAARRSLTVRMHWRDDLTHRDRIRWDGDDYAVTAIEELGRREGLELSCAGPVDTGEGV